MKAVKVILYTVLVGALIAIAGSAAAASMHSSVKAVDSDKLPLKYASFKPATPSPFPFPSPAPKVVDTDCEKGDYEFRDAWSEKKKKRNAPGICIEEFYEEWCAITTCVDTYDDGSQKEYDDYEHCTWEVVETREFDCNRPNSSPSPMPLA